MNGVIVVTAVSPTALVYVMPVRYEVALELPIDGMKPTALQLQKVISLNVNVEVVLS